MGVLGYEFFYFEHCTMLGKFCWCDTFFVCLFVVFTLGNNALGQCGRSIIEGEVYEGSRIIHTIERTDVVKVVCGYDHTLMLTADGKVFSCGLGTDGQTGV